MEDTNPKTGQPRKYPRLRRLIAGLRAEGLSDGEIRDALVFVANTIKALEDAGFTTKEQQIAAMRGMRERLSR
jgi:hypothetical protein